MSNLQQRAELQSQIWKIANDVRGSVDGWDFKQFVLGTLFYRFISENFSAYIEADDDSIDYASLSDSVITPEIKFGRDRLLFRNLLPRRRGAENQAIPGRQQLR